MSHRLDLPSLTIGISPCPNDVFILHAWIHHLIDQKRNIQPIFADIETLNELALMGQLPFCKVSAALLPHLKNYRLLPCGAALGDANGPKVIAKSQFGVEQLKAKRVVFPGRLTTAYSLYRKLLGPCQEEQFLRYDKLMPQVRRRQADAAVIIHESRFTFEKQGFIEICDLGKLWQKKMSLPLPLGIMVVRDDVSKTDEEHLIDHLRRSLSHARENVALSEHYVSTWAFEISPAVRRRHIDLFVNDETDALSPIGYEAIKTLNTA